MLIFAKDLDETKLIGADNTGAGNFSCALATFHSEAGALEAQERLNGKPNTTGDAKMIVELVAGPYTASTRNTADGSVPRQQSNSGNSSTSPDNPLSRQSSRYSTSFQNMNKISPPLGSPTAITNDFPIPSSGNQLQLQEIFSPTSPVANAHSDYHRISGKSVINDGLEDDDTEQMLNNTLAYAQNGRQPSPGWSNALSQFGNLSLNTNHPANGNSQYMTSPENSSFTSPQSVRSPTLQSPNGAPGAGANGAYYGRTPRHNYPPANPSDSYPPCNTLYVGNLPSDTSEDELKHVFSTQKGFKRLCFRTKHNGHMCFVEFEDVTHATKALRDLYGYMLHTSLRGGIRLSYSKNPLGVRSDPRTTNQMSPHGSGRGYSNGMGAPPGFSTANGPPPGLTFPGARTQQSYGASPMQEGVGRGQPPQYYANPNPQSRPQQGINGYSHHNSPNGSSGQYSYMPHGNFGSMNGVFADYN